MFEIIRLSRETAHLLQNLADDVLDGPVLPDSLAAFLADPRHVMVLAVEAGQVVGVGSAVEYFHPDKLPELWVNEVGVAPIFQRRGIGQALSEALLKEGEARGCRTAWLVMEPDNAPAAACYARVAGGGSRRQVMMYDWDLGD